MGTLIDYDAFHTRQLQRSAPAGHSPRSSAAFTFAARTTPPKPEKPLATAIILKLPLPKQ